MIVGLFANIMWSSSCKKQISWHRNIFCSVTVFDTIFHDWRGKDIKGLKIKLSRSENYLADYILSDSTDIDGLVDFEIDPEVLRNDDVLFLTYKGLIDSIEMQGMSTLFRSELANAEKPGIIPLYLFPSGNNKTKLTIRVFESKGIEVLPFVNVHLFTSKMLADSLATDFVYASSKSNPNGDADFRAVKPGNYYISAIIKVGADTLKRISKPISIHEGQLVAKDSIVLNGH